VDINYEYYKIFYYVAKHKSITNASYALYKEQPNVTRTIKKLEQALECTLFERTRNGITLTPEGEKLYERIKIAQENIELGERELAEEKALQGGTVTIATTEVALHCVLLDALKRFKDKHPSIKISLSGFTTLQAINSVSNGLANFALVTTPFEEESHLSYTPIKTIKDVAICSNAFSELLNRKVSLSELVNFPIISLNPKTMTYRLYDDFFRSNDCVFSPTVEATITDQIPPMVKADLGIGFIPEDFAEGYSDINIIDLIEDYPQRNIVLVKRKNNPLSLCAKELEKFFKEQ